MDSSDQHKSNEQLIAELAALRESEAVFRGFFENSPLGKSMTSMDGTMKVNQSFGKILGYKPEELSTKKWQEITHKDDIQESSRIEQSLVQGEISTATYEKRYIHKKGHIIWTKVDTTLKRDANNDPQYFISSISDISKKRKVEALQNSEEKFQTLIKTIPLPLCLVDHAGKINYINDRFIKVFGYTLVDIPTQEDWWLKAHPDETYRAWVKNTWNKAIENANMENIDIESIEYNVTCKNGEMRICVIAGITLNDGFLATFMDITDRKNAELKLNRVMQNLERSNEELEQFAYVASHDLQEPLRMVASYTQLLERRYKDQLDQDARDFIEYAVDGAHRMQRLINDLLDYSRVTTRGNEFSKIDLCSVLGRAVANLHDKIQETHAIVSHDELPFCWGDENQLARVFQNLIDNAIKFKSNLNPHIHITHKKNEDGFTIAVKDNGIGMDAKYHKKIFTIFQRLHGKTDYPGTGIGLAICKRIVERHGGKIWIESSPGEGTTFYFTLNIERKF